MIIIKLFGGLGNQMFQYALGRALSLKHDVTLILDLSWFKKTGNKNNRPYRLDLLKISSKTIDSALLSTILKIFSVKEKKYFKFDPNILKTKNRYFIGFWQNEKYFSDIKDNLIKEFGLKNKLSDSAQAISSGINSCNSISIHIRRGDFISKSDSVQHGTCSPKYYHDAMKIIEEKIPKPTYYIFSDEIDWAKQNIVFKHPTIFVSNSKMNETEEMVLMSNCKHNIIANSTFSWWAAWLNANINKIVIAPKKWGGETKLDYSEIIPSNWIKI